MILAEMSPTAITAIGGLILSAITGAGAWFAARPKDKATAADTLADTAVKLTELAASQSMASQHQYAADMLEVRQELSQIREQNAQLRASGPVVIGSKGQSLTLAASVPMEHVLALKNMGYDLLSPDRDEMRRALVFLQSEQGKFMTTDKKVFTTRHQRWA